MGIVGPADLVSEAPLASLGFSTALGIRPCRASTTSICFCEVKMFSKIIATVLLLSIQLQKSLGQDLQPSFVESRMQFPLSSLITYGVLASASTLDLLDGIRTRFNLPALAACVVNSNRTVQAQAAGYRKYGTPINATANDQYHLGSNTKAMTAVLIAKYIEEGNKSLTWTTTLAQALPDWRDTMQEAYRDVTIRQLASHHSGITDEGWLLYIQSLDEATRQRLADTQSSATAEDGRKLFVELFLKAAPTGPGRDTFSYTNQNYIILGYIVDTLFGPWESQLEQRVWGPLNMTDCGYGNYPEPSADAAEGIWPHAAGNPPVPLPPTWQTENPKLLGPAGTARCSPESYSKFLAMHLDGAMGQDTAVLRSSTFANLHTPYLTNSGRNYTAGGWMSLYNSDPKIGTVLGHDGSNTWNYVSAIVMPQRDAAVFAMTNVAGPEPEGSEGAQGVGEAIQRYLDGELDAMPVLGESATSGNRSGSGSGPVSGGASVSEGGAKQLGASIVLGITMLSLVFAFL